MHGCAASHWRGRHKPSWQACLRGRCGRRRCGRGAMARVKGDCKDVNRLRKSASKGNSTISRGGADGCMSGLQGHWMQTCGRIWVACSSCTCLAYVPMQDCCPTARDGLHSSDGLPGLGQTRQYCSTILMGHQPTAPKWSQHCGTWYHRSRHTCRSSFGSSPVRPLG